jgi:hypothetical protein
MHPTYKAQPARHATPTEVHCPCTAIPPTSAAVKLLQMLSTYIAPFDSVRLLPACSSFVDEIKLGFTGDRVCKFIFSTYILLLLSGFFDEEVRFYLLSLFSCVIEVPDMDPRSLAHELHCLRIYEYS